jgi:hypothetical protein
MYPNANFLRFFPDAELPETEEDNPRSSCLQIGNYLVLGKLIEESRVRTILLEQFSASDTGLILDLAYYAIVTENNAGQYNPDYAYHHPLFTEDMKVYTDTKVSDFLKSITTEQRIGFLNAWNKERDHCGKIYISYDSTNKACQAGDIEMSEFGHEKVKAGKPIVNQAVAYDGTNREPLFYEAYTRKYRGCSPAAVHAGEGQQSIPGVFRKGYGKQDIY